MGSWGNGKEARYPSSFPFPEIRWGSPTGKHACTCTHMCKHVPGNKVNIIFGPSLIGRFVRCWQGRLSALELAISSALVMGPLPLELNCI